jgi:hypothetical protein
VWTKRHLKTLQKLSGILPLSEIARRLKRTERAVRGASHLHKIGPWVDEDPRYLTLPEITCALKWKRTRVFSLVNLGLPYYDCSRKNLVALTDLREFFTITRPEILDPLALTTSQKKTLGLEDWNVEPPNFKLNFCDGYTSRRWPDVKISHDPLWICTDLYQKAFSRCPACKGVHSAFADAYTNDFPGDFPLGECLPEGAWLAVEVGRVVRPTEELLAAFDD